MNQWDRQVLACGVACPRARCGARAGDDCMSTHPGKMKPYPVAPHPERIALASPPIAREPKVPKTVTQDRAWHAVRMAVDAALGEVSRQQAGIAGNIAREARSDAFAAAATLLDPAAKARPQ